MNERALPSLEGPHIRTIAADLTRQADCARVAGFAAGLGTITGLFNCAGLELHGTVVDMPEEDWDRVIAVNLKAIFLLSKHVRSPT